MFQDFSKRHRAKLAALLLVLLPVGLILTGSGTGLGQTTQAPVRVARAGVGWVQLAIIEGVGGAGGLVARWFGDDLAKENAKLRAQNERLREEKSRLIGVLQENARLRQLVGFKREHPEYEVVPARIVSRNTTPYFRVMTVKVQVDSATPLKPRMPVLVAQGVVGLVHKVYGEFAEVVVLSDPRTHLDAVSQRNRAHGVVQGLGHDRDYQAKVSFLSEQDAVRKGDVFVTSGMGGVFPPEIVIGTVSHVEPEARGLFQNVTLLPAVDLSRLQEVFVVTALTPATPAAPPSKTGGAP